MFAREYSTAALPLLQDAASVASLLIITEAMVADRPKKETPPMSGGGGGMGDVGF